MEEKGNTINSYNCGIKSEVIIQYIIQHAVQWQQIPTIEVNITETLPPTKLEGHAVPVFSRMRIVLNQSIMV
jgi:hypothetical protein